MDERRGELVNIAERNNCTEAQWESFFKNECWRELMDTVNVRLALVRDDLEMQEDKELYKSQGDARTLRFFLALEDIIKAEFEAATNKENQDG